MEIQNKIVFAVELEFTLSSPLSRGIFFHVKAAGRMLVSYFFLPRRFT
jgi:hypothetical protein